MTRVEEATIAEALDTVLAIMDDGAFLSLVRRMREAQKAYFKTRTRRALAESKSLESCVDSAVSAIEERRCILTKNGLLIGL